MLGHTTVGTNDISRCESFFAALLTTQGATRLFDRPRLLSQNGAQTARGEQAVTAYEQAVQSAYGDAEKSLTTLSADLERLDYLIHAEDRARFAFSAQQQGYRPGNVDLDTLLQTEKAWRARASRWSRSRHRRFRPARQEWRNSAVLWFDLPAMLHLRARGFAPLTK